MKLRAARDCASPIRDSEAAATTRIIIREIAAGETNSLPGVHLDGRRRLHGTDEGMSTPVKDAE